MSERFTVLSLSVCVSCHSLFYLVCFCCCLCMCMCVCVCVCVCVCIYSLHGVFYFKMFVMFVVSLTDVNFFSSFV